MRFERAVPVLRVFDQAKAEEFYIGYLGFATDWEHRFEPDSPRYAQISRSELSIHLSEHHRDGTPGRVVFLPMQGIREFHAELTERNYQYARPGLQDEPWGLTVVPRRRSDEDCGRLGPQRAGKKVRSILF